MPRKTHTFDDFKFKLSLVALFNVMLFSTHFWVTYLNSIILVFLSLEMR